MKTQLNDFAGIIFVLAIAIVLPILAGAELDRRGVTVDFAHPAFVA